MEDSLHGSWGKQVFEVDAAGGIVRELLDQHVDPIAGEDIQLTIDLDVQQYAEQALETKLKERRNLPTDHALVPMSPRTTRSTRRTRTARTRVYASSKEFGTQEWIQYKAPAGAVVVEDNSNGQILAMASYPRFDNRWMGAIDGDKFDQLFGDKIDPITGKADPDKSVLVNRAVQGRYNLGSTFKPFVAWSAMHSGVIGPNEPYLDKGEYKLESIPDDVCASGVRCVFKNASNIRTNRSSAYGPVTVADALAVSSDAFFYRLGEKFWEIDEHNASIDPALKGKSTLKDDLERFGFGADSGVQLPFEWPGRIPDDAIKAELVKDDVLGKNEEPRLLVGDNVQVAIGQGLMAATPLQLANAYSTIANGGFLYTPTVVKTIFAPLVPGSQPRDGRPLQGCRHQVVRQAGVQGPVGDAARDHPADRQRSGQGHQRLPSAQSRRHLSVDLLPHDDRREALPDLSRWTSCRSPARPARRRAPTAIRGTTRRPSPDSASTRPKPYTVVAYLEKSGFGAKAAAPVVKCIFTALAGQTAMDPVLPSDPLDLNSLEPAPPTKLTDSSCMPPAVDARD